MAGDDIKQKFLRAYHTYRAAAILTNAGAHTPEIRERLDRTLLAITQMGRKESKIRFRDFQKTAQLFYSWLGLRVAPSEIDALFAAAIQHAILHERDGFMLITKHELCRVFSKYEERAPQIKIFPPHTRISVNVNNLKSGPEIYLLEGMLFEDLAGLWNSMSLHDEIDDKQRTKSRTALVHAVIRSAYSLLEGFLNGLATDVLLTTTVDAKTRALLEEWNSEKDRPANLSLRDKILQYPKAALGVAAPVLDEGRSKYLQRVLALEREVRHVLTHPNPRMDSKNPGLDREQVFISLNHPKHAGDAVDNIIGLICEINAKLDGRFGDVKSWLFERDAAGLYPVATFE